VAADERYHKLLGIEPSGDIPHHYELLGIDRTEQDAAVIEANYKERMRKLQQVRSSKDKGFVEFLKEELRTARLTLTNPKKRNAYDESLLADTVVSFREWVQPMMALGRVPKSVYDTMVSKGVQDGLSPDHAAKVVEELAQECDATIEADGAGVGAASAGPAVEDTDEPLFTDDLDPDAQPLQQPRAAAPREGPATLARDRGFWQDGGQPQAKGPGGRARQASPWARGGRRGGAAWGRRKGGAGAPARTASGGRPESTQTQRDRWKSQSHARQVDDARRMFNLGAKLAKVASEVHHQLKFYFPPDNGRSSITYQRNGVSYEKVFDTEQKTYRDALKKFEAAVERLEGLDGPQAQEVRARAGQNAGTIKGILDEIRQHKLRQLAGLSKAEELRMWQAFVKTRRPARLTQTIGDG